jgi:hypothetical protein
VWLYHCLFHADTQILWNMVKDMLCNIRHLDGSVSSLVDSKRLKCSSKLTVNFYLWVLHPVAHLSNWFFMMPSIATKFQYVNPPFYFHSLHVSTPTGHLQVRYTIRYLKDYCYYNGSVACTQLDV